MTAFETYSIVKQFEQLAEKLTSSTQIPHAYFEVGTLMLRNCSFGPDGAQEYEVYKRGPDGWYMFESITVSWMNDWTLKNMLAGYESQQFEEMVNPVNGKPLKLRPMRKVTNEQWEKYKSVYTKYAKVY